MHKKNTSAEEKDNNAPHQKAINAFALTMDLLGNGAEVCPLVDENRVPLFFLETFTAVGTIATRV